MSMAPGSYRSCGADFFVGQTLASSKLFVNSFQDCLEFPCVKALLLRRFNGHRLAESRWSSHLLAPRCAAVLPGYAEGVQCEARVRERNESGLGFGPIGRQCSREADEDVCGIGLCDQHRRMVTRWIDGREELRPDADHMFAKWGVTRTAPFVGEHDLYPID